MPPESQVTSDSNESIVSYHELRIKSSCDSENYKYHCSTCNERFKRLDHLDRHEFHHTGVKKHACYYDGCDKVYSISTHLKRHVRNTHECTAPPSKSVSCEVKDCDKKFTSYSNMQRHIREVHENPKIYSCSFCDEKFSQKLKMRRHEICKHTGEYPFKCSKCSKGFYQQWQCEKHTPTCKIYPCSNCNEQFEKWSLYIKHCKETQHGRKYHKCELCNRVYGKPSDLQKHITAKHSDEDIITAIFKCSVNGCQRVYSYERNLKQHVRTAHSGERFNCQQMECVQSFSSAQNLIKHIQREHDCSEKSKAIFDSQCTDAKAIHPNTELKRKRKKRKDAGKCKVSHLAKLCGLPANPKLHKLLREREPDVLKATAENLSKNAELQMESLRKMSESEENCQNNPQIGLDELIEMTLANV